MVNLPDSAKDTANFHLFTSLRYDPLLSKNYYNAMLYGQGNNNRRWGPFYMLRYHRDRILEAAQYFKWKEVSLRLAGEDGLRRFEQDLWDKVKVHAKENSPGPLKVRCWPGNFFFTDLPRLSSLHLADSCPVRQRWRLGG